jgi:hypothetical protein
MRWALKRSAFGICWLQASRAQRLEYIGFKPPGVGVRAQMVIHVVWFSILAIDQEISLHIFPGNEKYNPPSANMGATTQPARTVRRRCAAVNCHDLNAAGNTSLVC